MGTAGHTVPLVQGQGKTTLHVATRISIRKLCGLGKTA